MATETFDAEVRARVPDSWKKAVLAEAETLALPGEKPTEAPVLRVALSEFFKRRKIKITNKNGKVVA